MKYLFVALLFVISAAVCKSVNYRFHRAADTTSESGVPKEYFRIDGKDIDSETLYQWLLSAGNVTLNRDRRVVRNPQFSNMGVYKGDAQDFDALAMLKLMSRLATTTPNYKDKDLFPIKPVYDSPLDVNGP